MRQLGLDSRPVRSSSLASRPAQRSSLHGSAAYTGWWPARRAALLENERNGPRRLASLISLLFLYMSSMKIVVNGETDKTGFYIWSQTPRAGPSFAGRSSRSLIKRPSVQAVTPCRPPSRAGRTAVHGGKLDWMTLPVGHPGLTDAFRACCYL